MKKNFRLMSQKIGIFKINFFASKSYKKWVSVKELTKKMKKNKDKK